MTDSTIQQNLETVRRHICITAKECGRAPEQVKLLAVSKTKPTSDIVKAIAAGQRLFGENYVQEGVEKICYFNQTESGAMLEWHFIGPLQSNKSRLVAEYFDWVHTVDRVKIAQRLSDQRPLAKPPLNILIQINISDEASKSGIPLTGLDALAEQIVHLPHLCLRGLMAIPAPEEDEQKQRDVFYRMANAFEQLKQRYHGIDTLSIGMSGDMTAAISSGSTLVRIGSAIFGARNHAYP